MKKLLTLSAVALAVAALLAVPGHEARAFERSAMSLQFNPDKDTATRYLFTLFMGGTYVSPGRKDQMDMGEYAISTVFKDTVTDSLPGQNRHKINFYSYDTRALDLGNGDRSDQRFGGSPFPNLNSGGGDDGGGGGGGDDDGGGGGGGGGGDGPVRQPGPGNGGGQMSQSSPNSFTGSLGLPDAGQGGGTPGKDGSSAPAPKPAVGPNKPMQSPRGFGQRPLQGGDDDGGGGGGGGGGRAGSENSSINLDSILINEIDYVTNKQGEILDVGGLDLLRKVSTNRAIVETDEDDEDIENSYIDINIGHVFEWTHMLYLPTYEVYKEDIWFHSMPLHVPGLPADQPVLTKFMYKLIDFRTVGTRKVAVIDMSGVCEWNQEWETQNKLKLTEFKSWGNMGVSARIWYDYEANVVFAMERPPFVDWQYQRFYEQFDFFSPYVGGLNPFTMRYPGMVISMEFFYNTRETDISGKPRLVEVEPKERRRYVALNMLAQMEAE